MPNLSSDEAIAVAEWLGIGGTLLGAVFALGRLSAQFKTLQQAVIAIHRRIDELEYMLTQIREALLAAGLLRPLHSHSRNTHTQIPEVEEEKTPV